MTKREEEEEKAVWRRRLSLECSVHADPMSSVAAVFFKVSPEKRFFFFIYINSSEEEKVLH